MAKRRAKTTRVSSKKTVKRAAKKSAPKRAAAAGRTRDPLSLGGIHQAMTDFIAAVNRAGGDRPALVAARNKIAAMMDDLPACAPSDDPRCQEPNPPKDCGFVAIPPK